MSDPRNLILRGYPNFNDPLPLFISNDILVGTTSMYADYIFPDFDPPSPITAG